MRLSYHPQGKAPFDIGECNKDVILAQYEF